jgi:hypothetical protein
MRSNAAAQLQYIPNQGLADRRNKERGTLGRVTQGKESIERDRARCGRLHAQSAIRYRFNIF